jgi:hypothetical protein
MYITFELIGGGRFKNDTRMVTPYVESGSVISSAAKYKKAAL